MISGPDSYRNSCHPCRWWRRSLVLALVSFLYFGPAPTMASAQDPHSTAVLEVQGLHISAEGQTIIDIKQSSIEYSVNVNITLEAARISADNVKILLKSTETGLSFTPDSVKKIIARGNVHITFENGVATAREAVYDAAGQTLELSGEPATFVSNELDMSCPVIRTVGFTL